MGKINKKTEIEKLLSYQSKYCYKGTNVLINKLDVRDANELMMVERSMVTYNLSRLRLQPIRGNFDINHYIRIHKYLFEDLYDFAGKIRSENMSKGNTPFCRPEYIYSYLKKLLISMNNRSDKLNSEEVMLDFLAYYFSEINIIHPFRDGNGRTQREFFRQYMHSLNKKISFGKYEMDYSLWDAEDRKNLILGSVLSSHHGDLSVLKSVLSKAIVKVEKKELGRNR